MMKQHEEQKEIDYAALLASLLDDNVPLSIPSLYQLSDMPVAIFEQFAGQWLEIDELRRAQIARHMADISEENYQVDFTPFATLFLEDSYETVRLATFDILWDSTNTGLIPMIIAVMEDDASIAVRAAATATLGHYILMMEWGQIPDRTEGVITTALLKQLKNDFTPLPIKRSALESIASIGTEEVHQFIDQAYADDDRTLKLSAVFAMGRTADARWLPHILRELDSSQTDMRAEAAQAAGMIGKSEAVEQLSDIAKYDDDIEVRIAAVHALGQIGGSQVSETLHELSEESDEIDSDELNEAIANALEELDTFNFGDVDLSLLDFDDHDDEHDDYILED